MKLYAIKWQGEENDAIGDDRWFKFFGCMVSSITEFEGRVIGSIVERNGGGLSGPWYTHSEDKTHAGKTGMALKLWWAGQQKSDRIDATRSALTDKQLAKLANQIGLEFLAYRPDLRPFEQAIFIGNGRLFQRFADGKYEADKESCFDILPPAPKLVERWVAVYSHYYASSSLFDSKLEAESNAPDARSYHPIQVPE